MKPYDYSQPRRFENSAVLIRGRERRVESWETALNLAFVRYQCLCVLSLFADPEPYLCADMKTLYEFVFRHGKNRVG